MGQILLLRGAMGAGKTAIASKLKEYSPDLVVVEIDHIKTDKYGTTEKCNPAIDFTEAGRQARQALDVGNDVVVVEPLCEQQHIDFVLNSAGFTESSRVASVWLDCLPETAIIRKQQSHKKSVIVSQHRRYATRVRLKDEIIIQTDTQSIDDTATQVLQYLQQYSSSPT